jgi:sulfur carrier protein ThiS
MPGNIKVRVKLYARLDRYLPETRAERNEAELEVPNGTTVAEVFRRLGVPPEVCHLVLINGHFCAPGDRDTQALKKGDHLAAWPPVAGGVGEKKSAEGVDPRKPADGAAETKSAAGVDAKNPPGAATSTRTVITKEMAVTHADFFRTLPRALDAAPFKKTGNRVVVEEKGKRLDISLGPERTRQIAGLKVPAADVTLAFTGYDRTEIAAALRLFERSFQKGGG